MDAKTGEKTGESLGESLDQHTPPGKLPVVRARVEGRQKNGTAGAVVCPYCQAPGCNAIRTSGYVAFILRWRKCTQCTAVFRTKQVRPEEENREYFVAG